MLTKNSSSAFKTLMLEMLKCHGDFSKVNSHIRSSTIKCTVKQTYPRFLISDGTFFMQGFLTKDAFNKFHGSKTHNITDLKEAVITISKWECELLTAMGPQEATSYNGLEMRLIIHDFKVKEGEHVNMIRVPANLYRDDDVKSHILLYIS
jgi:hypothetical protein